MPDILAALSAFRAKRPQALREWFARVKFRKFRKFRTSIIKLFFLGRLFIADNTAMMLRTICSAMKDLQ